MNVFLLMKVSLISDMNWGLGKNEMGLDFLIHFEGSMSFQDSELA